MSGSLYAKENGYDMFGDEDDSSDIGASSSEDEIDVILHGTPEQRRKLQNLHKKWIDAGENRARFESSSSTSEDEFEKEMDAELTSHIQFLENSRDPLCITENPQPGSSIKTNDTPGAESRDKKAAEEFYDEVYFDSDDDDNEDEQCTAQDALSSRKSKHKVISNDDLLYDPKMDDRDQMWVDKQRQSHRSSGSGKLQKAVNSDALLDCPACLTTLCIDCQRHEIHKHQYRAMFVMNCTVDTSETLECPEQAPKSKKKKKRKKINNQDASGDNGGDQSMESNRRAQDLFNPVRCVECNTVVGVYDRDEVYHFFNILASHT